MTDNETTKKNVQVSCTLTPEEYERFRKARFAGQFDRPSDLIRQAILTEIAKHEA